jgi:hypothetical protein
LKQCRYLSTNRKRSASQPLNAQTNHDVKSLRFAGVAPEQRFRETTGEAIAECDSRWEQRPRETYGAKTVRDFCRVIFALTTINYIATILPNTMKVLLNQMEAAPQTRVTKRWSRTALWSVRKARIPANITELKKNTFEDQEKLCGCWS